jgi:hypothetical protein
LSNAVAFFIGCAWFCIFLLLVGKRRKIRSIRRAGEIVTRDELMLEVWETTFWTSAKTIDVHLGWLRRKLGDDTRRPSLITTVRGQGLRFESEPPVYLGASRAS